MTEDQRYKLMVWSSIGIIVLAFLALFVNLARAHECPVNAPKCKIVVLTPEEEQALTGPNGIFDTAEKGAFVQLSGAVRFFREKIASAPAGDPPAAGKKPEEKK